MYNLPTVSVILPTHNRAHLLVRSINSVLNQTFADLECIIVDDASIDNTPNVVADFVRRDVRVRCYRHVEGRHASGARNSGLNMARGRYIAYHDDDDEWLPTKLEKQLSLFERLPADYGCVYCWADYHASDSSVIRRHRPSLRGDVFSKTLVDNAIGCRPSLLLRREAAEKVGIWNESLLIENDNEYIIRLCRICKVDYVPEVMVKIHTKHGGPQVSMPISNDSIQRSLHAIKTRYELFRGERREYRKQAAALEARIANLHGRLGDRRACARHFAEAFKLAPVSWEPYHMILSLIKWRLMAKSSK